MKPQPLFTSADENLKFGANAIGKYDANAGGTPPNFLIWMHTPLVESNSTEFDPLDQKNTLAKFKADIAQEPDYPRLPANPTPVQKKEYDNAVHGYSIKKLALPSTDSPLDHLKNGRGFLVKDAEGKLRFEINRNVLPEDEVLEDGAGFLKEAEHVKFSRDALLDPKDAKGILLYKTDPKKNTPVSGAVQKGALINFTADDKAFVDKEGKPLDKPVEFKAANFTFPDFRWGHGLWDENTEQLNQPKTSEMMDGVFKTYIDSVIASAIEQGAPIPIILNRPGAFIHGLKLEQKELVAEMMKQSFNKALASVAPEHRKYISEVIALGGKDVSLPDGPLDKVGRNFWDIPASGTNLGAGSDIPHHKVNADVLEIAQALNDKVPPLKLVLPIMGNPIHPVGCQAFTASEQNLPAMDERLACMGGGLLAMAVGKAFKEQKLDQPGHEVPLARDSLNAVVAKAALPAVASPVEPAAVVGDNPQAPKRIPQKVNLPVKNEYTECAQRFDDEIKKFQAELKTLKVPQDNDKIKELNEKNEIREGQKVVNEIFGKAQADGSLKEDNKKGISKFSCESLLEADKLAQSIIEQYKKIGFKCTLETKDGNLCIKVQKPKGFENDDPKNNGS